MPTQEELWRGWREAVEDAGVDGAIRGLCRGLDEAVARRGPTCWSSGKCCHFDAYGHRLYVTGLEIAWVLKEAGKRAAFGARLKVDDPPAEPGAKTVAARQREGGCPFQVERLCSVHAIRPMGCRVFFCQKGTEEWQRELYEEYLGRLRRLHEERGLVYCYMEWRAGLAEAGASLGMQAGPGIMPNNVERVF